MAVSLAKSMAATTGATPITMGPLKPNPAARYSAYNGVQPVKSGVDFPIYNGPAQAGMPRVQRAFASGKEQSGVSQLLPNLAQTSTNGAPQLTTAQLSRTTVGKTGFTPGEAYNMATERQNQLQDTQDARTQQALDLQKQAFDASAGIGQQARGRIAQDLQQVSSKNTSGLLSRGLGNSTVMATINNGAQRNAADANLGVDEQLMNRQSQYANQQSSLLTGQPMTDQAGQIAANAMKAKQKPKVNGQAIGQVAGAAIGGLLAIPTGGMSLAAGAALGSSIGGGLGGAFM